MPTPVSALSSTAPPSTLSNTASVSSSTSPSATSGLDSNAFLKLLVAQLKYQNPLSPTDPQALMSQTAQYSTVEQLQQLATLLKNNTRSQSLSTAAAFVGRDIVGQKGDGTSVQGKVTSVSRGADDSITLHVGTDDVPLDTVTKIG